MLSTTKIWLAYIESSTLVIVFEDMANTISIWTCLVYTFESLSKASNKQYDNMFVVIFSAHIINPEARGLLSPKRNFWTDIVEAIKWGRVSGKKNTLV